MCYRVLVDDNFHYMEDIERYEAGQFDTLDAAITACQKIVDGCLTNNYRPGMKAEELYQAYIEFGEDPFIMGEEGRAAFSAWDYAKRRAAEIVGGTTDGPLFFLLNSGIR